LRSIKVILSIAFLLLGINVTLKCQCLLDSVLINALLVDPSGIDFSYDTNEDGLINSNDEFVEICNTSSDTIDVSGWRIGDDDPPPFPDFHIPDSTYLLPGACLVMVSNYCPDMPMVCDPPSGVLNMDYQFSGFLGNSGDVVTLVDTLGNSCSVVYGSTVCTQIDLLEIPDFDINACDDWGADIDGCPLLALGDSCEYEPVVLPLEFLDAFVRLSDSGTVIIDWTAIETEPNTKYSIEWTTALNLPFHNIVNDVNAGALGFENAYTFEHQEPNSGLNYYKIVMKTLSGIEISSSVLVADIKSDEIGRAYPNIIDNLFYINGSSDQYSISIFDMSGKKVFEKAFIMNEEAINAEFLESGYYIINITTDKGFINQPIIKI